MTRRARERGATLLDAVVGVALMMIVFVGIVGAFRLTVQAVGNNGARAGAIALANERLEYIRSLAYDTVGTSGGIPSGALAQEETIVLNNTSFTRRTFVSYEDDPNDGTGVDDENDIVTDYKAVKTSVSWRSREGTRTITMIARLSPPGIEQSVPGGTLSIRVTNDLDEPVAEAQVSVVNDTTNPAIDTTTYTNAEGYATMLGAPPAADYEINVTKAGYSSAQTYSADAVNTNPVPAHLAVALNQTTVANFEIDVLSSLAVATYAPVEEVTWTDTFPNADDVTLDNAEVIAGGIALVSVEDVYVSSGSARSSSLAPEFLYAWKEASWEETKPAGTDIVYHIYSDAGVLIPEGDLPGNAAGFTSSPVSLVGLSASTYPALRIGAVLSSDGDETPRVELWSIIFDEGPTPIPDIEFAMRSTKTIGSGPSGPVYKLDQTYFTNDEGEVDILGLEYDTYTISMLVGSDYDVSSSCAPQPVVVTPGAAAEAELFLVDHTPNSLLIDVRAANGTLMTGVDVQLSRGAYDETLQTDVCGQVFFSNLTASSETPYTLEALSTTNQVDVAGTTRFSVILDN